MRINIAERLKPFSHTPGVSIVLPGSTLRFQCFPALLRVHDLSYREPKFLTEIPLSIEGPVADFTVLQDLEAGNIRIWGHTLHGYMRFRIHALKDHPQSFTLVVEKSPCKDLFSVPQTDRNIVVAAPTERLSLGSNKSQNWDGIDQRRNLAEIFPLWFRLGQLIPYSESNLSKKPNDLLEKCRLGIQQKDNLKISSLFRDLWLAGFDNGFSPRSIDSQFQGFPLPPISIENAQSPLALLTEGSSLIRSLFVQQKEEEILVLPLLPPEFHCGRFLHTQCNEKGILDFEWSKKTIRRAKFKANTDGSLHFLWQKHVKSYRLRTNENDSGTIVSSNQVLEVKSGEIYYFDRFEK